MLKNDTVGTSFPTQNATANYLNAQALPGTTNASLTIAGNLSGNSSTYYWPYTYPTYYPDYSLTGRVAHLEGEVKILREMVAALLSSGKAAPVPRKRGRK